MHRLMVQWPDTMAFDAFNLLPAAKRLHACFTRECSGHPVDPKEVEKIEQDLEREMTTAALVMSKPQKTGAALPEKAPVPEPSKKQKKANKELPKRP